MMLRPTLVMLLLAGACGSNEGPPDARVIDGPPPGGTFSLQWTLHEGASALACDDVGAKLVAVTIKNEDAGFGTVETFSCSSTSGTSAPLAPGLYTFAVELDDASGGPLGPVQTFMHVEIKSSQDSPLGTLDFPVVARGGLSIKHAAQGKSANCTAGGANIDATTLALKGAGGACVPATFAIAAGSTRPAATYVSDCNTLPAGPCIEQDQTITVTGLRSGTVELNVSGLVAGQACWGGGYTLTVPAMDKTKDYGTQPIVRDTTTCP
jgi:hypothetical protein